MNTNFIFDPIEMYGWRILTKKDQPVQDSDEVYVRDTFVKPSVTRWVDCRNTHRNGNFIPGFTYRRRIETPEGYELVPLDAIPPYGSILNGQKVTTDFVRSSHTVEKLLEGGFLIGHFFRPIDLHIKKRIARSAK